MKIYVVKSKKADGNNDVQPFSSKGDATKAHNQVKANGGTLSEVDIDINSKGILEAIKFGVEQAQVEMILSETSMGKQEEVKA